jgi:hypothetical protein
MKNIVNGCYYTNDRSDLKVFIVKVQYKNSDYIKFKGILINKKNNIVYETKNYKVSNTAISSWYKIKEIA